MKVNTNIEKIKEILERGVERVIEKESLLKKMQSGKILRVKLGIDPTGPKIHIGRAIQFWKLRAFQEMGHKIILIIGDFTAQIGDASDKKVIRSPLSLEEVKENMKDYKKQIGKIIDLKRAEIHYNSKWLEKISSKELIHFSMNFTAQQMIQRRNFKERWEENKPIGLHELYYPILQGYDSVATKADVEIGGYDQLFNLISGRKMQEIFGQPSQDIMVSKMLNGLDGRKMSTSWGNIITILDNPKEMYGKIMSMKDEFIYEYFELCTKIPIQNLEEIKNDIAKNPMESKFHLAREIVSIYYGKEKAKEEEEEFKKVFSRREIPSQIPEIKIKEKSLLLLDLIFKSGLASSKNEAKRLIIQGAVKINGQIERDWKKEIIILDKTTIQVGKRKFARIKN